MQIDRILSGFVLAGVLAPATPPGPAMKQFLNPEGVPKPTGWTQVVSSRPGRMIFVSGQGGASTDGRLPEDFASQARNTFENIRRCLTAAEIGRASCREIGQS